MRTVLAVLVVALAAPGAAAAELPEGFRESPALTVRAAKLSGKPTARVYCATTLAAWAKKTEGRTHLRGLTNMRTLEMSLPRGVCRTLEGHLAGRAFLPRLLAYHLFVFAHESVHLSGWESEQVADCFGLRRFPRAARLFGVTTTTRVVALRRTLARRTGCS